MIYHPYFYDKRKLFDNNDHLYAINLYGDYNLKDVLAICLGDMHPLTRQFVPHFSIIPHKYRGRLMK